MSAFDYDASAELYSRTGAGRNKTLKYHRFERASEAIRHAMEDIPSLALRGCSLDVADETYVGQAILPLYESADYPLPRRRRLARNREPSEGRQADLCGRVASSGPINCP
jgi:hypothetical protein